jgi:hypothetical protein
MRWRSAKSPSRATSSAAIRLIRPDRTAGTFPCGEVSALARTLDGWARDPGRLFEGGRQARSHVRRYSVERLVDGTVAAVRFAGGRSARRM